jgi:diacylglycerol kinase family enzyme
MPLIPALLNTQAGRASAAREALTAAGGFDVREVQPLQLVAEARRAMREGRSRIVVAGGDGSIATVAGALAAARTEIAVLPCGTLNHLAKDLGIPSDLRAAADLARMGRAIQVDAAVVNSRLFLNTSAVGASVAYIRARDKLEAYFGYRLSSVAAALRLLVHLPVFSVSLEMEGVVRRYLTPLVMVAVGERELKLPLLGARLRGGQSSLHVLVIRRRSGARTLALALAAAARGVEAMSKTPALDAFLVDACRIEPRTHRIALDGEIVRVPPPLEYRHLPGHLRIVATRREVGLH